MQLETELPAACSQLRVFLWRDRAAPTEHDPLPVGRGAVPYSRQQGAPPGPPNTSLDTLLRNREELKKPKLSRLTEINSVID